MLSNEYIDNLWIAHHDLYIKQKDSLYMKTVSKFNQIYLDDNFLTLLSFKKHNLKYLYMCNILSYFQGKWELTILLYPE